MECAKHTVDQYEPESSMPEAESYDEESLDKLLSGQMCYCQEERE